MNRRALVAVFLCALSVLLAATLPLRLVIPALGDGLFDRLGVSATGASGPVWSGRLRSATWHGRPQGDVALALRPLPLLAGTRQLHLAADSLSIDLLQGRRSGVDRASGQLELAVEAPFAGTLRLALHDAALVFADGRCHRAGGRVEAEFIAMSALPAPLRLSGPVSCDGNHGVLALSSGADGAQPVEATITIDAGGRYEVRSLLRSVDAPLALALQATGFSRTPAGLARSDTGRLGE